MVLFSLRAKGHARKRPQGEKQGMVFIFITGTSKGVGRATM
jgi:hypothetical protein